MKPQLYLINGPLGAGKTTFLRELLKAPNFHNARIIENEFASTSVDTDQLHDHHAEVQTIAGVCICCSTGDELTDALGALSVSSAPVIIEATGVANSLKLIEKIVVADLLDYYDIAQAIFIIDAVEASTNLATTIETYRHELKAADTVLVSKTDLIAYDQVTHLMDALHQLGLLQVSFMHEGVYDPNLFRDESHILGYFADLDDVIVNHDINTNYTIIDMQAIILDTQQVQAIWHELAVGYGIRRMKGNFMDINGDRWHIEATPAQCRITDYEAGSTQLVLIGSDAKSVHAAVMQSIVAKARNE